MARKWLEERIHCSWQLMKGLLRINNTFMRTVMRMEFVGVVQQELLGQFDEQRIDNDSGIGIVLRLKRRDEHFLFARWQSYVHGWNVVVSNWHRRRRELMWNEQDSLMSIGHRCLRMTAVQWMDDCWVAVAGVFVERWLKVGLAAVANSFAALAQSKRVLVSPVLKSRFSQFERKLASIYSLGSSAPSMACSAVRTDLFRLAWSFKQIISGAFDRRADKCCRAVWRVKPLSAALFCVE